MTRFPKVVLAGLRRSGLGPKDAAALGRVVGAEDAAALGLLPAWEFFRASPDDHLRCWLCGANAEFVTDGRMGWCRRHARDF
jgi:hypothetical protein